MDVDVGGFGFARRPQEDAVAAVGDVGDGGAQVDGQGEGQALVVVGVVPDQVHPTGAEGADHDLLGPPLVVGGGSAVPVARMAVPARHRTGLIGARA